MKNRKITATKHSHPLHDAIRAGDLKRIKKLVKVKNIDINKFETISGGRGKTTNVNPLYLALTISRTKLRNQILKVLLTHPDIVVNMYRIESPDPHAKIYHFKKSENGTSLIKVFIEEGALDVVEALVKHPKIDVDDVTMGMLAAVQSEHDDKLKLGIIKVLLSHPGLNVNLRYSFYQPSPSSKRCLHYGDRDSLPGGRSLLHIFTEAGDIEKVKALLKHPKIDAKDVSIAIFDAIESDDLCDPVNEKLQNDILETLLEYPNVDVNIRGQEGEGCCPLQLAIEKGQVKNVKSLLCHPNIEVNEPITYPSGNTWTPLTYSLKNSKTTEITKLLLEHPKIDVNKCDRFLILPLNMPVKDERTLECFKMLLNHENIDVNANDVNFNFKFATRRSGVTPLVSLTLYKEYRMLNWPQPNKYKELALDLLLKHHKIDLAKRDATGRNILHHLMLSVDDSGKESQYDNISELLENNPALIRPDEDGNTPLDLAKKLPDRFDFMKNVLEKYYQKIRKEKIELNLSDKETSKSDKISKAKFSKRCWNCDAVDKKLYKCTGCMKAYYCSKECITHDWPVHGGYCLKKQK